VSLKNQGGNYENDQEECEKRRKERYDGDKAGVQHR
jgi:hypothetical protein